QFLDAKTGKPVPGWQGPVVTGLRQGEFAPDGKSALFLSAQGIQWWDPITGRDIRRFATTFNTAHDGRHAIQFTNDGKQLVSHTKIALYRWNAATGQALFTSQEFGHTSGVRALGFAPDGRRIATHGDDSAVRIWDPSGRQLAVLPSFRFNHSN